MADTAGELTFSFGADFSGFSRAAEGAGRTLDGLRRAAMEPLGLTGGLARAADALRGSRALDVEAMSGGDATAARTLTRLSDQLALLRSTGDAHEAIGAKMRIEAEQAKLGADATGAQKAAVADLVTRIDAARAAQKAMAAEQEAVNDAWDYGGTVLSRGIGAVLLRGQSLGGAARSVLLGVAQQGLTGALAGTGPFAGLFGTAARGGSGGGLLGALQGLFGGGLGGGGSGLSGIDRAFSGLYAEGGTIGAGRWGVVGEKGAEVVAGPAAVVPWHRLAPAPRPAAAHQTITFNVTSPDAPSFARSEGQIAALLARAVGRGQRNS